MFTNKLTSCRMVLHQGRRALVVVIYMRHFGATALWAEALAQGRTYTMTIHGCQMQEYSMSNLEVRPLFGANHDKLRKLQTIIDSQRSVWEDLGAARPWWSVLSAEEYDRKLNLSESPFLNFGSTRQ